jgi:hypothetical protein
LKDAARLLDKKQTKEAGTELLTALNTLVIIDHVKPLPIVLAQSAVDGAEAVSKNDKNAAQILLATARNEVERAKELGYAGADPDYVGVEQRDRKSGKADQGQRRYRLPVLLGASEAVGTLQAASPRRSGADGEVKRKGDRRSFVWCRSSLTRFWRFDRPAVRSRRP